MKLDTITKKQDEYFTPTYAVKPILEYVSLGSTVWCPFDTEESLFVKMFISKGCKVINTHISNQEDFFELDIDCDYIISNPPYSLKAEVFERLFNLKKPFAMLVGVVGLFESQKRFDIFSKHKFEIMYFNRRVSYFKSYKDAKPKLNPPFSSVYLTSKMLPKTIIFKEIDKRLLGEHETNQP